jgi:hypothetical protein
MFNSFKDLLAWMSLTFFILIFALLYGCAYSRPDCPVCPDDHVVVMTSTPFGKVPVTLPKDWFSEENHMDGWAYYREIWPEKYDRFDEWMEGDKEEWRKMREDPDYKGSIEELIEIIEREKIEGGI